jgi:hypothetical protein
MIAVSTYNDTNYHSSGVNCGVVMEAQGLAEHDGRFKKDEKASMIGAVGGAVQRVPADVRIRSARHKIA